MARERQCSPVPRRNTQMWLMVSAAGSSKAALVSSICCRFVCKSLPATQQPNMVLWVSGATTRSFVRFVPVPRVFYALLVVVVWSFPARPFRHFVHRVVPTHLDLATLHHRLISQATSVFMSKTTWYWYCKAREWWLHPRYKRCPS